MQDKGFIKVPRGCVFQDIFKDPSVFYLYFMLLYLARYKAEVIDGVFVAEGQVLVTKKKLAQYVSMNEREVRTTLDRFERYGCITKENVRNQYTLITILPVFSDGKPLQKKLCESKKSSEKTKLSDEKANEASDKEEIIQEKTYEYKNKNDNKSIVQIISEKKIREYEANSVGADIDKKDDDTSGANINNCDKSEAACKASGYNAEKKLYGRFRNISLTEEQYDEIKAMTSGYMNQIDKLSAYLQANPEKKYADHYALICLNIENDRLKYGNRDQKPECEPDPTASYNIKRAEFRARTMVPKVMKKNRATGLWEAVEKD